MNRPQDEPTTEPIQALPAVAATTNNSKTRSNPLASSLYASTLSPPGSRPISPAGRGSPSRVLSDGVFQPMHENFLPHNSASGPGEPVDLILHSFVPHVAIYASEDTETLIGKKGFRHGLWELLRPFGEQVHGDVKVRDINGISHTLDDFSIRFTRLGENIGHLYSTKSGLTRVQALDGQNEAPENMSRDQKVLADVEAVVEFHLSYAEQAAPVPPGSRQILRQSSVSENSHPYYSLYLRRLLSGFSIVPQETFAHPVACILAISSKNQSPIEELRRLYTDTEQTGGKLPPWVNSEYLRYYVLVHDEEHDDITRSLSLFEQMKRHLGSHCHLLRLRCSQSVESDDDSVLLPRSEWISAAEELAAIRQSENMEELEDSARYIFESDSTALRIFVREIVTQSVIPTMERHISVWNDQVASRRRGLTGRIMNLSRKWAGIGGNSRSSSSGGKASRENYDSSGFYRPESPEAIMRKLADYAFMLRDWKLAYSVYDLLRYDFDESKAWNYHAAANEMATISLLLVPQSLTSKSRAESINQMLESALYSYGTRCCTPYGALRSLTLGHELLRLRGAANIDDASKWGLRLLETKMQGHVGDALLKERLAMCYANKGGVGNWSLGSRRRKSAVWSVLAADSWCQQAKYIPAQRCLAEAQASYASLPHKQGVSGFSGASLYIVSLRRELKEKLLLGDDDLGDTEELGLRKAY